MFKIIRKIGKMLRGGAGKREIFLGALCGVLIGFNPVGGLILTAMILITVLLNANLGFTLLGVLIGKIASFALAFVSFHTGFFIIHKMGLEGFFSTLVNTPVTALMNLNVYALIGSLPYALIIGIAFAKFMQKTVTKIREQMLKVGENEKIAKTVNNTFSKFLMWIAFGKQKLSVADVLAKESPLFRKSGIILVAVLLLLGLLFEFLFFDMMAEKSLRASIEAFTGAEVNIGKTHLSLTTGKYELSDLQITDRDKPTQNSVVIDTLIADVSVKDLLRRRYSIDHLVVSTLRRDVPRAHPGKVFQKKKEEKKREEKNPAKNVTGKSLDQYFAQAEKWKRYGEKAYRYLKKRRENAKALAENTTVEPDKQAALEEARKRGYLKARADLTTDHPLWIVRHIEIQKVETALKTAPQKLLATELSSHPELNGKPTSITLTSIESNQPTVHIVLHFEDPEKPHQLAINLTDISVSEIETADSFPVELKGGKADFATRGTFSADQLGLPFTLHIRDLKIASKGGKPVLGLDAKSAEKVLNSLATLDLDGKINGSLLSPKIWVDVDKLTKKFREAAVEAGKKELSNRGKKEVNKLLETEDGKKAKKYLKGFL